jgi:hypothetical protein
MVNYIVALLIFFISTPVALALTGSIVPSFRTASFLDAGLVNTGNFSFVPLRNVTVSDTELTGFFWGEHTGWINLNCANTNNCGTSNYRVSNTGYGILSGFAWGENTGWINFGPFQNTATPSIVINNQGEFNGFAWAENIGWLKFSCNPLDSEYPGSCTKTTWVPIPARPACSNTLDDDGDGLIDYPADAGCLSPEDTDESGPYPVPPFLLPQPPFFEILPPTFPEIIIPPEILTPPEIIIPPPFTPPVISRPPEPPFILIPGRQVPTIPTGFSINIPSFGNQILQYLEHLYEQVVLVAHAVINFSIATTIIIGIGFIPTLFRGISSLFFLQPIKARELFVIPKRLFLYWSPRSAWGSVYDAHTGLPLDPAFIRLYTPDGKEIATTVTNKKGMFGFKNISDGLYTISVYKHGYTFPSKAVGYHGEPVMISGGHALIADIPLDAHHSLDTRYIRHLFFLLGFACSVFAYIATPSVFSTGILVLYGMTYLFERSILAKK